LKTLWVLLIFLGKTEYELTFSDLDVCLKNQQKLLLQNQLQIIAGDMQLHAWCIPKKVKDSE
tara:strand:+ start:362 stop:547 length:186 start_codon:yes stop_codon:yes gene_type:complete